MSTDFLSSLFGLAGKTMVVTGGAGVLGSGVCEGLAKLGAKVAVWGHKLEGATDVCSRIEAAGGTAMALAGDVLDRASCDEAAQKVLAKWGRIDALLNFAGGNKPQATVTAENPFFDLPIAAFDSVVGLNLQGTVIPCQSFGKLMAAQKSGVILNVSSMSAIKPLTRVLGYGAAKAAVTNFTTWLAVHMASEYSADIRVNAIAPGFLLGNQNRALLVDEKTGELTKRGRTIVDHTPMRRFGTPDDLLGTIVWLLSPASAFVTGVVVPVDGGFSAFGGV